MFFFPFRYTYEVVEGIAKWLQERTSIKPKIGIICGTGLGKKII